MAEIVLGIGSAHTPQLHTMAKDWHIRGNRDMQDGVPFFYKGERMKYAELEKARAADGFRADVNLEEGQKTLEKCYQTIDELHETFKAADIDVAVIFGNDQREIFKNDLRPAFTVMACEEFVNKPRTDVQKTRLPPGIEISDHGHLPDDEIVLKGAPDLGLHVIGSLIEDHFDVAISTEQHFPPEEIAELGGMPHAYGFIYKQIIRNNHLPTLPIDLNTFCPPNQPRVARCIDFGRAVGKAIRNWDSDKRVALIATGGMSHFVVEPDFDHAIVDAMIKHDWDHLSSYHDGYFQAGNSEIKSWIACSAALAEAGLDGKLVDYQTLYRTPAGTGSSCCFMTWE